MPLGILEDHKLEHVPGTAPLQELDQAFDGDAHILKHDVTGLIVLVPQPSDSPNDPYNWPCRKKTLFTVTMAWSCACVGALAPLMAPTFVPLSIQYNVSLQSFVGGTAGGMLLTNAIGSIVFNTLAVKYGKRPFYLGTTLGLAITSFWAGASKSFASLVAARFVQGLCMGPVEALFPASIADIWFVHERGFRSAIFTVSTIGGISLAQPIAGQIVQYGSYRIAFYGICGAFIVQLLMMFFWMPETAFHREGTVNLDTTSHKLTEEIIEAQKTAGHSEHLEGEKGNPTATLTTAISSSVEPTLAWAQELRFYSGYRNPVSAWTHMLRPFRMLASPSVLWAVFMYTSAISWLVILSISLSQTFAAPPYLFSIGAMGATNVSSFVASMMGIAVSGPTIDWLARRMSKANKGIFEPEFRIPVCVGYIVFTATGAFVWGHSVAFGSSWPVPVVLGLGFMSFGIQLAVTSCVTYVVDCHRERSAEAVAVMNFFKGVISFVFTETFNSWIVRDGVRTVHFTMGGITVAVALTSVPMYIVGKRARSWAHRHHVEDKSD